MKKCRPHRGHRVIWASIIYQHVSSSVTQCQAHSKYWLNVDITIRMISIKISIATLISYCNKLPSPWWLEITRMYYLTILEVGRPNGFHWVKIKVSAGLVVFWCCFDVCFVFFWKPSGIVCFLAFSSFRSHPQSVASGPLPSSELTIHHCLTLTLSHLPSSFRLRTLMITVSPVGYSPHPKVKSLAN